MKPVLWILVLTVIFAGCGPDKKQTTEQNPPVARIENVGTEYWGTIVDDPYRYMEKLEDPYVMKWIKGQADYAKNILTTLPARQGLLNRMLELDSGKPFTTYGYTYLKDGTLFYYKRNAGENLPKLYVRTSSGTEKLLIDPEQVVAEEDQHYSIWKYSPSMDGEVLVYGLAKSGSEETVLHILDIKSGKHLPETIDHLETAYNRPQWLPGGDGFFYSRRQFLSEDAPVTDIYKNTKVYFHRLNTPVKQDQFIAGIDLSEHMPLGEDDFPSIYISSGSNHAVIKVKHGDSNELALYAAPIATLLQESIPWKKICGVEDEVTSYTVHGDEIYLQSAKDAPRFKVIRTSLSNPDIARAQSVVQESDAVVDYMTTSSKALYVGVNDGGIDRILRIDYDGANKLLAMELPDNASGWVTSATLYREEVLIRTSSWTKGGSVYSYNPDDNTYSMTDLLPKGEFDDLPGFESKEVKVKSHDGVEVPLSIIYRAGIELDGKNPALIKGYGAYGSISSVYYNPLNIAWLERGGVLAIAHIRGGGEYGKAWHHAGQKTTKPNTWKDFIACSEYLITSGYTSHELIAGQGGSAGGITIGRAITERPDLFKAAIINVGDLDAVRMETTTNGVPNVYEFGTVTIEEEFKGLLAMSSYHHVKEGTAYPAVLLTHGMNDPRVDPWNSAKMTARLQAATSSSNPVLFRVEYSAGHGIGSTRRQSLEGRADAWAFLLWQFGM
ncbi:MAG: S9 family peptidase [Candidatus Marinimicrobia bacterium]|nr:S9 family peptidase [Candidatus Neomarinimicrobiota bacterium]MBT4362562.1 S9 family peptidase [Candidatus Neomarinimicrobiota bacterium]MBT4715302.1 S9 family peptidase [Candidatus Neomarinimicrobiota bacterium]MBT4946964.1 S9 family peptidase [Candidatus Neomarinimicrobiota bacterium]MBT5268407.1 S9 family peptidase [Candidatus Neomarinimicrobiota bacterium]